MRDASLPSEAAHGDAAAMGERDTRADRARVRRIVPRQGAIAEPRTERQAKPQAEQRTEPQADPPGIAPRRAGRLRRRRRRRVLFANWTPRLSFGVRRRRPNMQEIALGALLTWFLLDPVRVASLALLIVCSAILLCFAIGPRRIGRGLATGHARIARHDPARAERLRQTAERLVDATAELAAFLPPHWTDGLYLPDLSPRGDGSHDIAHARLARMAAEARAGDL